MSYIAQGETNNYANSYVIDIWTHVNGILTDVVEMSFKIFDISTATKKTEYYNGVKNNVQIYPTTPGQRQSINVSALVTDPVPGHKIGTGHYYAPWTCSTTESQGDHIIEWFFRRSSTSNERFFSEEFVVTPTYLAPSSGNCVVTYEMVRKHTRDAVPKNILLDALDYSDAEIDMAIEMAVCHFNVMPVLTNYTCANFPSKCLLLIGTTAHLLEHNAHEQLRNQLGYNDGNIHMDIHDKHQLYLAFSQTLWAQFDKLSRELKNSLNLAAAWGDMGSPYSGV